MRLFHKISPVIVIILACYWDFELNFWVCHAHHCISDDLNKSNEQMTHCFDFVSFSTIFILTTVPHSLQYLFAAFFVKNFYDRNSSLAMPPQPRNKCMHIATDNVGNQCKNVYQFSWMVDYVNEDHGLDSIQHNFSCKAHGKGIHDTEGGVLLSFCSFTSQNSLY